MKAMNFGLHLKRNTLRSNERVESGTHKHALKVQSNILLSYSSTKNQKIGKMDIYILEICGLHKF